MRTATYRLEAQRRFDEALPLAERALAILDKTATPQFAIQRASLHPAHADG